MKSLISFLIPLLCLSSFMFADQRSLNDRIEGFGFLPNSQTITLDDPIKGVRDLPIESIRLTTPPREQSGNKLKLDEKRSIVLINKKNIEELPPDLKDSILDVVNNKSKSLNERGHQYAKPGLTNFYVLANFESSREAQYTSEWFVAIIPKSVQVLKVILQTEWFDTGVGAHNQVRMLLDQPVVGIPQSGENYTPYIFDRYGRRGDIVFALQAARVEDGEQNWDPLKGIMGEYGNALQFFDTQTLALDQITRSVIDELIVINALHENRDSAIRQKSKAVLEKALQISDSEQEVSIYNTAFASCVTYALKVLKAGVPEINTTWFNPYSINDKVKEATKITTIPTSGSVNSDYETLANKLGLSVMSWDKINKNHPDLTKAVALIQEPILKNEAFDKIIQKIALFILEEGINYNQVANFITEIQKPNVKFVDIKVQLNSQSDQLKKEIISLWKQNIDRPIDDLPLALKSLQSQPFN